LNVRGCLSVLVLGIAFLVAAIWFGGPPLASAVVKSTLNGSGFTSDTLDVTVTADPPLTLGVGRARSVVITATGVSWNGLRLASLALSLGSVDLIGRTAATAEGRFGGVQLRGTGGQPILADAALKGSANAARTTVTIDAATVTAMALDAFESSYKVRPSSASLVAPDIIRVNVAGVTVSGQLTVAVDGSIVVMENGSTIRLVIPDPALPFHLTDLSVTPMVLQLQGTLDVGSLLR
jgi:hypothetical protein